MYQVIPEIWTGNGFFSQKREGVVQFANEPVSAFSGALVEMDRLIQSPSDTDLTLISFLAMRLSFSRPFRSSDVSRWYLAAVKELSEVLRVLPE